jgi:hypothetical protein
MRVTEKEYLKSLEIVHKYKNQILLEVDEIKDDMIIKTLIDHCGFSVRLLNGLKFARDYGEEDGQYKYIPYNIKTIEDVLFLTKRKICGIRGLGKQSINELTSFLEKNNLKLHE